MLAPLAVQHRQQHPALELTCDLVAELSLARGVGRLRVGLEVGDQLITGQPVASAGLALDIGQLEGERVQRLERRVLLSVLDRKWREHLYEMDYLREGIGLRAYSQRDPLVEYQREGYDMFGAMMDGIKEESVGYLFNLEVQVDAEPEPGEGEIDASATPEFGSAVAQAAAASGSAAPHISASGLERPKSPQNLSYSAPDEVGDAEVTGAASHDRAGQDEFAGVGRNEECPCGSGKKYKKLSLI